MNENARIVAHEIDPRCICLHCRHGTYISFARFFLPLSTPKLTMLHAHMFRDVSAKFVEAAKRDE